MTRITRNLLREWCACYTDERIAELVPVDGLTPIEVLDLTDVPACDRLWAVLREEVIPQCELRLLTCKWARDALTAVGILEPRTIALIEYAEHIANGGKPSADWSAILVAANDARSEAVFAANSVPSKAAIHAACNAALLCSHDLPIGTSKAAISAIAYTSGGETQMEPWQAAEEAQIADCRAALERLGSKEMNGFWDWADIKALGYMSRELFGREDFASLKRALAGCAFSNWGCFNEERRAMFASAIRYGAEVKSAERERDEALARAKAADEESYAALREALARVRELESTVDILTQRIHPLKAWAQMQSDSKTGDSACEIALRRINDLEKAYREIGEAHMELYSLRYPDFHDEPGQVAWTKLRKLLDRAADFAKTGK